MKPIEILLENINKIISISDSDKKEFLSVIDIIPEKTIIDINDLSEKDSGFLYFFWLNIKKKGEALINKDSKAFDEIITEEVDYINKHF